MLSRRRIVHLLTGQSKNCNENNGSEVCQLRSKEPNAQVSSVEAAEVKLPVANDIESLNALNCQLLEADDKASTYFPSLAVGCVPVLLPAVFVWITITLLSCICSTVGLSPSVFVTRRQRYKRIPRPCLPKTSYLY